MRRHKSPTPSRATYIYASLQELSQHEDRRVNAYAVIIDCSTPYFLENRCKYLCILKAVDETLEPGTFLSVSMFARALADLPKLVKMGSILRIHRGQTKIYKERMQLSCEIGRRGAWVLFDPTEGQAPASHSGVTCTLASPVDFERVKKLREFARKYFVETSTAGISLEEAKTAKPSDFDSLCLVLTVKQAKISEAKSVTRIKLCDRTMVVRLETEPGGGFDHVLPMSVVRVRSANFSSASRLHLSEHSNILVVPEWHKTAIEFYKGMTEPSASLPADVRRQIYLHCPRLGQPLLPSKIIDPHGTTEAKKLSEVLAGAKAGEFFRVRVGVVETVPTNPEQWMRRDSGSGSGALSFQLIVRDERPKGADEDAKEQQKMYRLYCYSGKEKQAGGEFIELGADEETNRRNLRYAHRLMTRPWVALDLLLRAVPIKDKGFILLIADTRLDL